jgi:hypothetical protein
MAWETHNMWLEAYGDDALSQMMTYKWFRFFKKGKNATGWQSAVWLPFNFKVWSYNCPLSVEMDDWLSKKLQKGLKYPFVHGTQF